MFSIITKVCNHYFPSYTDLTPDSKYMTAIHRAALSNDVRQMNYIFTDYSIQCNKIRLALDIIDNFGNKPFDYVFNAKNKLGLLGAIFKCKLVEKDGYIYDPINNHNLLRLSCRYACLDIVKRITSFDIDIFKKYMLMDYYDDGSNPLHDISIAYIYDGEESIILKILDLVLKTCSEITGLLKLSSSMKRKRNKLYPYDLIIFGYKEEYDNGEFKIALLQRYLSYLGSLNLENFDSKFSSYGLRFNYAKFLIDKVLGRTECETMLNKLVNTIDPRSHRSHNGGFKKIIKYLLCKGINITTDRWFFYYQKIIYQSCNPLYISKWRREFGFKDHVDIFVLIVLLSDNYFKIMEPNYSNKSHSFFNITVRLPIELQMLISNYAYQQNEQIITSTDFNLSLALLLDINIKE